MGRMAANPYIVTTDDLTTAQELAIARNTRAQVLSVGKSYQTGAGGATRMLTRADLPEINETIRILQEQLDQETEAASGVGGNMNLVKFARPS